MIKKLLLILSFISFCLPLSADTYKMRMNPQTNKGDWVIKQLSSDNVITDISLFDNNLSSADNTLQKALSTLDNMASGTSDHSALSNLAYATAGHTGFLQDGNDVIDDDNIDNTTPADVMKGGIVFTFDGGGSAITAGKQVAVSIPYNCTVTSWDTLVIGDSGSIVIDIWKDTYANHPPTVADSIAGSEKPSISSGIKNQDLNLTTWVTTINAGDILIAHVDSVATISQDTLILSVTKN